MQYLQSADGGAGDGTSLRPRYECERSTDPISGTLKVALKEYPLTHPSFRNYMLADVVRDCKETTCSVSEVDYSDATYEKVPGIPYEVFFPTFFCLFVCARLSNRSSSPRPPCALSAPRRPRAANGRAALQVA